MPELYYIYNLRFVKFFFVKNAKILLFMQLCRVQAVQNGLTVLSPGVSASGEASATAADPGSR